MAVHQVLGEGWETTASDQAAVHEALDTSEKIFVCLFACFGKTAPRGPGHPHPRGF